MKSILFFSIGLSVYFTFVLYSCLLSKADNKKIRYQICLDIAVIIYFLERHREQNVNKHMQLSFKYFILLFLITEYFAYNTLPLSFPFRTHLEYYLDSGAYYVVDLPSFDQTPNPELRCYFVLFSFIAVFSLVSVWNCCCCSSTKQPNPFSSSSSYSPCFIRTDVYSSLKDATQHNNPISSQIIQVNNQEISTVHPSHYKSD